MAVIFKTGVQTVYDPSPTGPTPISNVKDVVVKVIKLSYANFTTTGVDALVAKFPADSTILEVVAYTKVALSGGGITAATISLGSTSGGTDFASAVSLTNTSGAQALVSPLTNVVENYLLPLGSDISLYVHGVAAIGNPTAGEVYLFVKYVR